MREYSGEMNIHFPGWDGLTIPTVWVFPRLLVCVDCGQAQFTIPDEERKTLIERDYRGWANEPPSMQFKIRRHYWRHY